MLCHWVPTDEGKKINLVLSPAEKDLANWACLQTCATRAVSGNSPLAFHNSILACLNPEPGKMLPDGSVSILFSDHPFRNFVEMMYEFAAQTREHAERDAALMQNDDLGVFRCELGASALQLSRAMVAKTTSYRLYSNENPLDYLDEIYKDHA